VTRGRNRGEEEKEEKSANLKEKISERKKRTRDPDSPVAVSCTVEVLSSVAVFVTVQRTVTLQRVSKKVEEKISSLDEKGVYVKEGFSSSSGWVVAFMKMRTKNGTHSCLTVSLTVTWIFSLMI